MDSESYNEFHIELQCEEKTTEDRFMLKLQKMHFRTRTSALQIPL